MYWDRIYFARFCRFLTVLIHGIHLIRANAILHKEWLIVCTYMVFGFYITGGFLYCLNLICKMSTFVDFGLWTQDFIWRIVLLHLFHMSCVFVYISFSMCYQDKWIILGLICSELTLCISCMIYESVYQNPDWKSLPLYIEDFATKTPQCQLLLFHIPSLGWTTENTFQMNDAKKWLEFHYEPTIYSISCPFQSISCWHLCDSSSYIMNVYQCTWMRNLFSVRTTTYETDNFFVLIDPITYKPLCYQFPNKRQIFCVIQKEWVKSIFIKHNIPRDIVEYNILPFLYRRRSRSENNFLMTMYTEKTTEYTNEIV